jgi:hypothetical protein
MVEKIIDKDEINNTFKEIHVLLNITKTLCEIYFNIAAEAIGEEEVRRITKEKIKDYVHGKNS